MNDNWQDSSDSSLPAVAQIRQVLYENIGKTLDEELFNEINKYVDQAFEEHIDLRQEIRKLRSTITEKLEKANNTLKYGLQDLEKCKKQSGSTRFSFFSRKKALQPEPAQLREVWVPQEIYAKEQPKSLLNKFLEKCKYDYRGIKPLEKNKITKIAVTSGEGRDNVAAAQSMDTMKFIKDDSIEIVTYPKNRNFTTSEPVLNVKEETHVSAKTKSQADGNTSESTDSTGEGKAAAKHVDTNKMDDSDTPSKETKTNQDRTKGHWSAAPTDSSKCLEEQVIAWDNVGDGFEIIEPSDVPAPGHPVVLIPCVVASPVSSHLSSMFEDAGLDKTMKYPNTIVIIFIPKAPRVPENVVPMSAKTGDEFKVKDIINVVFWDNDFYKCRTNDVAVTKMKNILANWDNYESVKERDKLKEEHKALNEAIVSIEKQLENKTTLTQGREKFKTQHEQIKKEKNNLKQENEELKEKVENLEKQLEQSRENINEFENIQEERNNLKEDNKELKEKIDSLGKQCHTGNITKESQQSETTDLSPFLLQENLPSDPAQLKEVWVPEEIHAREPHQSILKKFLEKCKYTGKVIPQPKHKIVTCAVQKTAATSAAKMKTLSNMAFPEKDDASGGNDSPDNSACTQERKDHPVILVPCVVTFPSMDYNFGAVFEDAGLDKSDVYPNVIMIVFMRKPSYVPEDVASTFTKMGDEFRVKDMVDVMFFNDDFYKCHTNEEAVVNMKTLLA